VSVRPTFMGFEASKSAIFASQKALDITGQNLANMSTEGYTRQRADQVSVSNEEYKSRICGSAYNHLGMGTSIEGISQVRDERMDTAFRNSYSDTSYYNKSQEILSDIESILTDPEVDPGPNEFGYGLIYGIESMHEALNALERDPTVKSSADVFASSVDNICKILNRTSAELTEAKETYISDFQGEVSDCNSIIEDISVLNRQIKDVMSGYSYSEQYGPNELIDKRNMLLDELSAFGKIEVKHQSDGTVDVTLNRHQCIKGEKTDKLVFQEKQNGGVSVNWGSDNQDAGLENGILKASLELINGRGVNAANDSDRSARGFNYYQDVLDTFANKLAGILNSSIPETIDEQGKGIKYRNLVGEAEYDSNGNLTVNVNRNVTAANISVSESFMRDPSQITRVTISHPNGLENKIESSSNQYIQDLKTHIFDEKHEMDIGNAYARNEKFTGTLNDFVIDFTGKNASDVTYAKTKYEQSESYSNELQNNRDSVTNVSETEETMNMLTFNKAFQAAAKMMTTMDELLDVVINQIGALG